MIEYFNVGDCWIWIWEDGSEAELAEQCLAMMLGLA